MIINPYVFVGQSVDPIISSVVALLHLDGADGSTTFTDNSSLPSTFTTKRGSPSISTAQSKFSGASLYCGVAGGNGITTPDNANVRLGSTDWTIEGWVYPITFAMNVNGGMLVSKFVHGTWCDYLIALTSTGQLIHTYSPSNAIHTGTIPLTLNAWNHFAVCHNQALNTLLFFVNGVLDSTFTSTGAVTDRGGIPLNIGSTDSVHFAPAGWIDDVRITKAQRYTATFTPPTAAYPDP